MAKRVEQKSVWEKYKIWIIVGIIVVILALSIVSGYNKFITLDQNVDSKWSEVENQYQRQADLIPNIISTVSSQVDVETQFVKDVIEARTNWQSAQSQLAKDTAGQQMNNGITALVSAVAESYPVLQASEAYTALRDELAGTQNRITTARGRYIESIQLYNTAIKRFPANIMASIFGFGEQEYYTAEDGALNNPVLGDGELP